MQILSITCKVLINILHLVETFLFLFIYLLFIYLNFLWVLRPFNIASGKLPDNPQAEKKILHTMKASIRVRW